MDWTHLEEAPREHRKEQSTLEPTRTKNPRAPENDMEKRGRGGDENSRKDVEGSRDSLRGQRCVAFLRRRPVLHWELRGKEEVLNTESGTNSLNNI